MMEAREETMDEQHIEPQPHVKVRPRSFFTRKIEAKLEGREDRIPQTYLSLLDTPFDSFSPEDHELYECKLKPTFNFFSELLLEVFDQMGRPEEGWEESTKLMPDCPAKVVAMLALYEYRQNAVPAEDPLDIMNDYAPPQPSQQTRSPMERIVSQDPPPGPQTKKIVKKPVPGQGEQKTGKWWEKKIF